MAATEDDSATGETLADANRRKLNWLEERFEERLDELEAENAQLRREIGELKDGGSF